MAANLMYYTLYFFLCVTEKPFKLKSKQYTLIRKENDSQISHK